MKRVLVLGSGGAGKSTFARRLGSILEIEVIHLDSLYWQPGWVEPPREEWRGVVAGLLKKDEWIIDGNYGNTRAVRLEACDTVVFLDIPRPVCMYRILKRAMIYRNRTRPDMAKGCNEQMTWDFMMWVWNYPSRARPKIINELADARDKNVIILRSSCEAGNFLEQLRSKKL